MPAESRAHPFPATRWSIVARAGVPMTESTRQKALADLCTAYWYPLYAFARGKGSSPADAEDLTQSFFAYILTTDFFNRADAERGKLRTFLLTALTRHMGTVTRDANRQKRGGGQPALSIDLELAEGRLQNEFASDSTIEAHYEKRWALSVLASAMAALEAHYQQKGKHAHFAALKVFLEGADDEASYAKAVAALGLSLGAVRQEVSRMRQKFRQFMRGTVADTLAEPTDSDIEAELADLKRALQA